MIVEYRQDDGSVKQFGYMMSDGPVSAATGAMVRGWHHKCFWVAKKREARGDAVTGRVMAGGPTGYDIDQLILNRDDLDALGITPEEARERSTAQLSARVRILRELAESMGKGVGDAQVQEAYTAALHGGPYAHHHDHRLDTYQLIAHLEYAHGLRFDRMSSQQVHLELHAAQALAEIQARRADDGETGEDRTTDWREQFTAQLKE